MKFVEKELIANVLKKEWKLFLLVSIFSFASTIKSLFFPLLLGKMSDILKKDSKSINKYFLSLFALYIVFLIMGSVKSILRDRLILKIKQYLYNTFYLKTIENLETNFTKIPTSDYYSNVHKYTKNIIYLFNNLTKRIGFFILVCILI